MLSPKEEAFVRNQAVARLATADAEGRPSVIPICFVYLDGRVYTPVDEKPKSGRELRRLRNISANPEVALIFDRYDHDWAKLAWVLVRGKASLVRDDDDMGRAISALRQKYPQYRSMALEERPMIQIDPERASSWGSLRPAQPTAKPED